MLPSGFKERVGAADIHVSPDGEFLYASNRGDANELIIFKIDRENGKLEKTAHQSTLGKAPRNFNFDPSGKFLLAANQSSDEIVIFNRDEKSGLLTDTKNRISVGKPVCLKWIGN
jgi:6-phosphogluconolactonase